MNFSRVPREDETEMGNQILTIPNVLSLLRLALVPVVVFLLLSEMNVAAVAVFGFAAATDFFDGQIARLTRPTRLGTILDPIADRLMLSSSALVLAVRGTIPIWVAAVLVVRDLLALVGGLVFGGKISVNPLGKAATALLMISVAVLIFAPSGLAEAVFYIGVTLSLVAGLLYLSNVFRIMSGGDTT